MAARSVLGHRDEWVRNEAPSPAAPPAAGLLSIDLAALRWNYRRLGDEARGAEVAGVVKADAYGLGLEPVARALSAEGCRSFFTAHLSEALTLRAVLPTVRIMVLNGLVAGSEGACAAARIVPVLNSLDQVRAWSAEAGRRGQVLDAAIQVDSGMSRLGLSPGEVAALRNDPASLAGIAPVLTMSHLACADEPGHPANAMQLRNFRELAALLPPAPLSLANSAGIFLGPDFRFDLVRPGIALYGGRPFAGPNPMRPVVRLRARIVQIRDVPAGAGIGYGFGAVATRPMRLATIGVGYADGWPRRLGNHISASAGERPLPMIGRVSMDSIILDVGDAALQAGDFVDLLGPRQDIDAVAEAADTISYEILTSLGHRFERRYLDRTSGARA